MRIATVYGERTLHFNKEQSAKPKYFFAYEGSHTEVQYFNGIIEHRDNIGIHPLIELIPLLRSLVFESEGHPKRIFHQLTDYLENTDSAEQIIEMSVDYFCINNAHLNAKRLYDTLKSVLQQKQGEAINSEEKAVLLEAIVDYMKYYHSIIAHIDDLSDYLNSQAVVYDKEIDSVCIIIDRNIRNLKDGFGDFLGKCVQKGFRLFVTNPDFELWLLMHSDEIFNYSRDDLFYNRKINRSKTFLEKSLSEVFQGYKKENIQFERFLPHIERAIINEKHFCEDISDLEHELGSNIGMLINEIKIEL